MNEFSLEARWVEMLLHISNCYSDISVFNDNFFSVIKLFSIAILSRRLKDDSTMVLIPANVLDQEPLNIIKTVKK